MRVGEALGAPVLTADFSTIRKFIRDVLGETVSRGYLRKVVEKVGHALDMPYAQLLDRLPLERLLNVDETGHKENGARFWTWVFRADLSKHRQHSLTRFKYSTIVAGLPIEMAERLQHCKHQRLDCGTVATRVAVCFADPNRKNQVSRGEQKVTNRKNQVACANVFAYLFLCRTCWHRQLLIVVSS